VLVLELVGLFIWPFYFLSHPTPVGVRLRVLRREYVSQPSLGIQPLLIHIASDRRLQVNGRAVLAEDFVSAIRDELPLRPVSWPVYIEASPDLEWQYALRVVEAVQAFDRNVVLLKSRQPFAFPPAK
jgi:hypothetical protein